MSSAKQFHGVNKDHSNSPQQLGKLNFTPSTYSNGHGQMAAHIEPTIPTTSFDSQTLETFHTSLETEMRSAMEQTTKRMESMMDEFIRQQYQQKQPIPTTQPTPPTSTPTIKSVSQPNFNDSPPPSPSMPASPQPYYTTVKSPSAAPQMPSSYNYQPKPATSKVPAPAIQNPTPMPTYQPLQTFDNQTDKRIQLLEKELEAAYQREQKLQTTLESIEQKLSNPLPAATAESKEDAKPAANDTATQSKFASLSAELNQVVKSLSDISAEGQVAKTDTPPTTSESEPPTEPVDSKPDSAKPEKTKDKDTKKSSKTKADDSNKDKKSGSKKFIYIGIAVFIILSIIGATAYFFFGRSSTVDEQLLREYLPEDTAIESPEGGIPQDTESNNTETQPTEPTAETNETPAVQGVSTSRTSEESKYAESYADLSYGETRWETYTNPQLGISFDYPINASNVVRTDTSVTVLRRNGYIFKVQSFDTGLDLQEYWKNIKARSLRYKVQESEFRELPSLELELEDITDYPGDRILVKKDDKMYDIWYATPSKNLEDDDAKRIEIMLNSFSFLE